MSYTYDKRINYLAAVLFIPFDLLIFMLSYPLSAPYFFSLQNCLNESYICLMLRQLYSSVLDRGLAFKLLKNII